MSADNGIYIGVFDDGYRVIEAQAIDNCEGSPDDETMLAYIHNYFKHAKLLSDRGEAWQAARKLPAPPQGLPSGVRDGKSP